jgi:hypothetical protein
MSMSSTTIDKDGCHTIKMDKEDIALTIESRFPLIHIKEIKSIVWSDGVLSIKYVEGIVQILCDSCMHRNDPACSGGKATKCTSYISITVRY